MTKMPEDLYGALTCLNIMDCVYNVKEGNSYFNGVDSTITVYLNIPFIGKHIMETLSKVGSVIGIIPIEDEMVAISCLK